MPPVSGTRQWLPVRLRAAGDQAPCPIRGPHVGDTGICLPSPCLQPGASIAQSVLRPRAVRPRGTGLTRTVPWSGRRPGARVVTSDLGAALLGGLISQRPDRPPRAARLGRGWGPAVPGPSLGPPLGLEPAGWGMIWAWRLWSGRQTDGLRMCHCPRPPVLCGPRESGLWVSGPSPALRSHEGLLWGAQPAASGPPPRGAGPPAQRAALSAVNDGPPFHRGC